MRRARPMNARSTAATRRGGGPLLERTIRGPGGISCSPAAGSPPSRWRRRSTIAPARSSGRCSIVVMSMWGMAASGMLSNPTTEMSCGMRTWLRHRTSIMPQATRSLYATMAVGRRPSLEQAQGGCCALTGGPAGRHDASVTGKALLGHGGDVPVQPRLVAHVAGAARVPDLAVAESDEVPDELPHGRRVVDPHGVHLGDVETPIGHDDGHVARGVGKGGDLLVRCRGADQHHGGAPLGEQAVGGALEGPGVGAERDRELVPAEVHGVVQQLHEGHVEGLRRGEGDPDEGVVVAAELAGPLVGPVAEVGRCLQDPFPGGGTGSRDVAEDRGHQGAGDARPFGDVAHRGRPARWVGHQSPPWLWCGPPLVPTQGARRSARITPVRIAGCGRSTGCSIPPRPNR